MHRLLSNVEYNDLHDLESNPVLLMNTITSFSPKEFYAFAANVKKRKAFHEERACSYVKLCKENDGKPLWSKETEREKAKEDASWLKIYDSAYDNPKFWFRAWKRKKEFFTSTFRLSGLTTLYLAVTRYDEDDEEEDKEEEGGGSITMDEYFLRCIEVYFGTESIVCMIENIGRLLLNDERILATLQKRKNVDNFESLVTCGLLSNVLFDPPIRSEIASGDESINIPVSHMQNAFYLLEKMLKKDTGTTAATRIGTLKDPKNVIADFMPSGFPLKSRLYASAFVQAVKLYCHRRCNVKKDLVFVLKASVNEVKPKEFFAYDLKHNVVFDNIGLFFKYNVYKFKQNAENSSFCETLCFHDDDNEITNACIEFGFERIMEFDVLEQLMSGGLILVTERAAGWEDNGKRVKRRTEWVKWNRLFDTKDNELRSISLLPCFVKSDADLLSCDPERLDALRTMVEFRHLGGSRFSGALEYLLKLYVSDLDEDRLWGADSENAASETLSSPEALRYFFVKKRFLTKLLRVLTSEEAEQFVIKNEIESIEDLEEFLNDKAPFITYSTLELDQEDFSKYSHLLEDGGESFDDEYDSEEEEENERRFKKIRTCDLNLSSLKNRAVHRTREDRSMEEEKEEEEEEDVDDEPTDYGEEDEDEEEKEERETSSTSHKRKRTVKITMCNVHKDCFLFNDSFFTYLK